MDSIAYYPFPTEIDSSNKQHITLPQELYDNFDTNFRLQLQNKYNIFVYDVDSDKIKQFKVVITPQGITLSKKIYGWLNGIHVINQSLEVAWNNQLNNGLNLRIMTKTQRKVNGKLPTWGDIIKKNSTILLMSQVKGDDDINQVKGCLVSIVEMIRNNPPDTLSVRQLYDMITKAEELSEKDVDVKWLQSSLKSIKALKKLSKTQIALNEADDRRSQVNAEIEEAEERWNEDKAAARLKKLRKELAVHQKEYNAELDKKKELLVKLKNYGAKSSSSHRSYPVL